MRATFQAMVRVGFVVGSGFAIWVANAALVWDANEVIETVPPGEQTIRVSARFKNTGVSAVRVIGVKTDCGCARAVADREVYAPGEVGVVTIDYTASSMSGVRRHQVRLVTAEPADVPAPLALVVNVPEWFLASPRVFVWAVGSVPEVRAVVMSLTAGVAAEVVAARVTDPGFDVGLEPFGGASLLAGADVCRGWKLIVVPHSTAVPARATIEVKVRFADGREVEQKFYARVR